MPQLIYLPALFSHLSASKQRPLMGKSFDDEYFMKEALKEAAAALEKDEIPVGVVIVCHDRIIARAHNEVEALQDPTAHAEILAITAATHALDNKYLSGCTVYVTVEPCPMCAGALYWARPDRVVFATGDEKRGYRRYAPQLLHPGTIVNTGILADKAQTLMKEFFLRLRNTT